MRSAVGKIPNPFLTPLFPVWIASRHHIAPQIEHFLMSKINEAFARIESGNARYRIVLDADF